MWSVATRTLTAFGFTVTVGTNNDKTGYSLTQAFPTNFSSLAITAGGAVTAGTVSDKTGYSLTQSFPANFASMAITAGGAVTAGTVSDKTGYSLTQGFPSNFASLVISAGGVVSANVVQWNGGSLPTIGTSTLTAADVWTYASGRTVTNTIPSATDNAAAVWGASLSTYTTAGTFGGRIVRSDSSNVLVKLTGSAHIAADIHELQPAVITAAAFDLGAVDANALAADAASEIAAAVRVNLATELGRVDVAISTRLATSGYTAPDNTSITAIKAKTDNLPASPAATGDIPSATTIADAVLGRSVATVQATAAEWSLCTLVLAALESSIVGSTWTIYRTDGTTPHATKTITTDAAAEPVTGVA